METWILVLSIFTLTGMCKNLSISLKHNIHSRKEREGQERKRKFIAFPLLALSETSGTLANFRQLRWLYQSPRAAVTKCDKPVVKNNRDVSSPSSELGVGSQGVLVPHALQALDSSWSFPLLMQLPILGLPWLVDTSPPIPTPAVMWPSSPSMLLFLCVQNPSNKDTSHWIKPLPIPA